MRNISYEMILSEDSKGGGGVRMVLFSLKLYTMKAKIIPIHQYTSCRRSSGRDISGYKNDKLVGV